MDRFPAVREETDLTGFIGGGIVTRMKLATVIKRAHEKLAEAEEVLRDSEKLAEEMGKGMEVISNPDEQRRGFFMDFV